MSLRLSPQELAEYLPERPVLTDEQAAVVGAPLTSRLVVAGAGAGKTFVMALRVVALVANGLVEPEAVLGLTFTRKAAGELGQRIRSMLAALPRDLAGADDAAWPRVSTYDAYAGTVVRNYGLQIGADPDARILTQGQRWRLARDVVEGWGGGDGLDVGADWLAGILLQLADQCADNEVDPPRLTAFLERLISDIEVNAAGVNARTGLKKKPPAAIAGALAALTNRAAAAGLIDQYRARKAELGAMDFADQAAWARRLAQGAADSPAVAVERDQFKAVLLDEFQDTSSSQIDFLSGLFAATPVMAVGDPNQSIYGWRGASATALTAFLERFQAPGRDGRPAAPPVSRLTVARRSGEAILAVANQLVEPLRRASRVELAPLAPRPGAVAGQVKVAYFETAADEAAAIAAHLAEHWATGLGADPPRTAAVLVRARSQIEPLTAALEEAGLDHEVVGRGGLLAAPEVRDLVSALAASQDLSRGDAFMRLAASPRFAIGIRDLDALARLARRASGAGAMAGRPPTDEGPPGDREPPDGGSPRDGGLSRDPAPPDAVDRLSVVDALELLAEPGGGWGDAGLSPKGLRRLRRIGRTLRRLRQAAAYLSLPELILEAERALGLDVDLLAGPGPGGRRQIDRLIDEAHNFSRGQDAVGVGEFLEWLEQEEQADGLDRADVPAPGGAVQVLTVHAAKGLEWDVVCVPGLAEGRFPAVGMAKTEDGVAPEGAGWLSDARRPGSTGGLPWPLRQDRAALPGFDPAAVTDHDELIADLADFRRRVGRYLVDEDRRVAYVAVTRAKTHLFLSGAWIAGGAKVGKPPSPFLRELVGAGLASDSGWAQDPGQVEAAPVASGRAVWPPERPAGLREPVLRAAGAAVERAEGELGPLTVADGIVLLESLGTGLADRAAALLRERGRPPRAGSVTLPDQNSATALIGLASGAPEALAALRRPVPAPPSRGASLGEEFHRRAALELAAAVGSRVRQDLLDPSLLAAQRVDSAAEAQLESLMSRFRESRWGNGQETPVAVETELEIELLGRAVVARIDAVFRDRDGRTVVVDWKTGRSDRGRARPAHAQQVRLYQAALARREGVRPDQIGGYVHYIMENLSAPVTCPPDFLAALAERLAQVASRGGR
ncbi:MAG: ATP-dependent helicase [Bifidobacteriaceae bacterium]|nr:ATP-dependent helicase [Bifidobacteriaceae bacterium]